MRKSPCILILCCWLLFPLSVSAITDSPETTPSTSATSTDSFPEVLIYDPSKLSLSLSHELSISDSDFKWPPLRQSLAFSPDNQYLNVNLSGKYLPWAKYQDLASIFVYDLSSFPTPTLASSIKTDENDYSNARQYFNNAVYNNKGDLLYLMDKLNERLMAYKFNSGTGLDFEFNLDWVGIDGVPRCFALNKSNRRIAFAGDAVGGGIILRIYSTYQLGWLPPRSVTTIPGVDSVNAIAHSVAYSPDGKWVALTGYKQLFTVYDVTNDKKPRLIASDKKYKGEIQSGRDIVISPDSDWLVVLLDTKDREQILLYKVQYKTKTVRWENLSHTFRKLSTLLYTSVSLDDRVESISLSPEKLLLAVTHNVTGSTTHIFDLSGDLTAPEEIASISAEKTLAANFSPKGGMLALGTHPRDVAVYRYTFQKPTPMTPPAPITPPVPPTEITPATGTAKPSTPHDSHTGTKPSSQNDTHSNSKTPLKGSTEDPRPPCDGSCGNKVSYLVAFLSMAFYLIH